MHKKFQWRRYLVALFTGIFAVAGLVVVVDLPGRAETWSTCNTGLDAGAISEGKIVVDSATPGKCIITFKNNQMFTLPDGVSSFSEALVVGGGGGGGFNGLGGGGGAGRVLYRNTNWSLGGATNLSIVIGGGGADGWRGTSAAFWSNGDNGGDTYISYTSNQVNTELIRAGGGGGGCGSNSTSPINPTGFTGSAGGACVNFDQMFSPTVLIDGWESLAKNGGAGGAGGGGGAGAAGASGDGLSVGVGGDGVERFGLAVAAGGGGWDGIDPGTAGGGPAVNSVNIGGQSIKGSDYTSPNADRASGTDGAPNTGSGGGAARDGGSGVVKIAYIIPKTVTFNANGGTGTMAPQSKSSSGSLNSNAFNREGYSFAGWSTTQNGPLAYANQATFDFTSEADTTLYARWVGATDSAATLTGTSQHYVKSGATVIPATGGFTVEAWLKPSSTSNQFPTFISQGTQNRFYAKIDSNNQVIFYRDGMGGSERNCGVKIPEDKWTHVAISLGTSSFTCFINGKSSATDTSLAGSAISSTFAIGHYAADFTDARLRWAGQIDQVKIWNVAITDAELISRSMHAYSNNDGSLISSGLVSHYEFNAPDASLAVNDIYGSNHLTAVGSPTYTSVVSEDTNSSPGRTIYTFTRSYLTGSGGWVAPNSSSTSALIVGAGGGGGKPGNPNGYSGGSGAGGAVYPIASINFPGSAVSIIVGQGGAGSTSSTGTGTTGGFSSIGILKVAGGAGGNSFQFTGTTTAGPGGSDYVAGGNGGGGRQEEAASNLSYALGGAAGTSSPKDFNGASFAALAGVAGTGDYAGDAGSGGLGGQSNLRFSSISGASVEYGKRGLFAAWNPTLKTFGTGGSTNYGYDRTGLSTDPGEDGANGVVIVSMKTKDVITFNSNYGTPTTSAQYVPFAESAALSGTFSRTGFTLAGWSTTSSGAQEYNATESLNPTGDLDLFAVWTSNATTAGSATLTYPNTNTAIFSSGGTVTPSSATRLGDGEISYATTNTDVCSVNSTTGVVTTLAAGNCAVTMSVAQGNTHLATSTTTTIEIAKGAQATLTVTGSATMNYLATQTLSHSGGSGTGAVSYSRDSGNCAISGAVVTASGAGTCVVKVTKAGDANYTVKESATLSITINKIAQATLNITSASSMLYGQTITLNAAGGSGPQDLSYTLVTPGVCEISQSAPFVLSATGAGTCEIKATNAASANYLVKDSATITFTVNKASRTASFTSTVPTQPVVGGSYVVSGSLSAGGGSPTFAIASASSLVCSISSSTVTFITSGSCVVEASKVADSNYNAAPVVTQTIAVGSRNQTITLGSIANKTFGSPAFGLNASSTSTLAISYSEGASTNDACDISATGLVTIKAVGICEIRADQAGNSTWAAASRVVRTFNVLADLPGVPFLTSVSAGNESMTATFYAPGYTGGEALVAYEVVAVSQAVPYANVINSACSTTAVAGVLTCTVNNLVNGVSYKLRVSAINSAGKGDYSALSGQLTVATAPEAVGAFTAVANNSSLNLNWTTPASMGGGTWDSYRIYVRPAGGSYPVTNAPTVTINGTNGSDATVSWILTGLENGTAYDVKIVTVTSVNAAPLSSNTAEVRQTPRTVPDAPAELAVLEIGTDLVITWSPPQNDGGSAIDAYVTQINGQPCAATGNTCVVPVPTAPGAYQIEVKAQNDAGHSAPATAIFTRAALPVNNTVEVGEQSPVGKAPLATGPNGMQVIAVDKKKVSTTGGSVVKLDTKNMANITSVTVDGKKAKIISLADGQISVQMPKNTVGDAKIVFTGSAGTVTMEQVISYAVPKSVDVVSAARISQGIWTIASPVIQEFKKTLLEHPDTVFISCVAYQSTAYNTPLDATVAKNRAKNACAYLASQKPGVTVKASVVRTKLTGPASRKLKVTFSAVR